MNVSLLNVANTFPHIALTIGILFLFLSPVTIIGNGLVLASIARDPNANIRSAPTSYIIFNMALADLLVGVLVEPIFSICTFYVAVKETFVISEEVIRIMTCALLNVSFFSSMALSVDRLIAIRSPLQYGSIVSKTKLRNVNILMWVCVAFYAIAGIMVRSRFEILLAIDAASLATLTLVLSVLNFAVVRSLRISGKKMKSLMDSENTAVMQTVFNRGKTVARTTTILVTVFLVCLLPNGILSAVIFSLKKVHNLMVQEILAWMYYSSLNLMFLNSLINPFLYAWRLPKYRKAFRYIFFCIKSKMTFSKAVPSSRCEERNKDEHRGRHSKLPQTLSTSSPTIPRPTCISALEDGFNEHIHKSIENTKL